MEGEGGKKNTRVRMGVGGRGWEREGKKKQREEVEKRKGKVEMLDEIVEGKERRWIWEVSGEGE